MGLIKFIFVVIFRPIIWLSDKLQRPKDTLLEWEMNFEPFIMKIKMETKEDVVSDELLITAYLLYLSRYFYVCDERQVDAVRGFYILIKDDTKPGNATYQMFDLLLTTLNAAERNAAIQTFSSFVGPSSIPAIPAEEEFEGKTFGRYFFSIYKTGSNLRSYFTMSLGLDIILMPLSTVLLYIFVLYKFKDKNSRKLLDHVIQEMLDMHGRVNYRSLLVSKDLPLEIIKNNSILI